MQDWFRPDRIRRRLRRARVGGRLLALSLIAALLAASLGVAPSRDWIARELGLAAGTPYPCAGGRCGCASARECWTTCTCQTMAEKIAWAERRRLDVPPIADRSRLMFETGDEPACPLCESHASETSPREPRGLPALSPLGCKGIASLIAAGIVVGLTDPPVRVRARENGVRTPPVCAERAPSRPLDVPSPPPRARAA